MDQEHSQTHRWARLDGFLVGGAILLALAARFLAGPRTVDDAYITFRYARNLAEGVGFVYNPGQQVLGTSTPLYTLWMAMASLMGLHDLPSVALALNALADAGTTALLYWLALRLVNRRAVAAAAALAWALSPWSVTFASGGMETSVLVLFLVASFAAYVARRSRLSAALMALAVLTRPDALIAALLLFADMGLRPLLSPRAGSLATGLRRLPWAEVAIFAGLLIPWLVFAGLTFGSPLPQSVSAKALAYHSDEHSALLALVQSLSIPFFEHETLGRFWPAAGFPLYLFLYIVGCLRQVRAVRQSLPAVLYPAVYVLVFAAANPPLFRWYLVPPLPFYFLGILIGLYTVLDGLARRLHWERMGTPVAGLATIGLVGLALNAYTLHPDHGLNRPAPVVAEYKPELAYRRAAERIRPFLQPGDVVAVGDIGVVGWETGAPILDTVGLISPEALPYYPVDPSQMVTNYAMPVGLIRDYRPEYLIAFEVYMRETLLPDPWFQESYKLIEELDTGIETREVMFIFEHNG